MSVKVTSIRLEEGMLNKLRFVAAYEGRSINRHISVLVRDNIIRFEEQHGKIEKDIHASAI